MTTTTKPRRMAREPHRATAAVIAATVSATTSAASKQPSKLDQVQALLLRSEGVSIAEVMAATGWQQHSVRGAMAGALKKRGLIITSEKVDGLRRYRAGLKA